MSVAKHLLSEVRSLVPPARRGRRTQTQHSKGNPDQNQILISLEKPRFAVRSIPTHPKSLVAPLRPHREFIPSPIFSLSVTGDAALGVVFGLLLHKDMVFIVVEVHQFWSCLLQFLAVFFAKEPKMLAERTSLYQKVNNLIFKCFAIGCSLFATSSGIP